MFRRNDITPAHAPPRASRWRTAFLRRTFVRRPLRLPPAMTPGSSASPARAPAPAAAPAPCATCGASFAGTWCPACGEKRLAAGDQSLRGFAREALETLTNLDSTFVRTYRALAARPGLLTREYLAGRRTRWLRPLQVFVFSNVLFFFAQPLAGFDTLTTPLRVHLYGLPYSGFARRVVEREVAARGVTLREYELLFDATLQAHARTLVLAMVPLLALLGWLLHVRSRPRPLPHVVFALHFYAFLMPLLLAVWLGLGMVVRALRAVGAPAAWLGTDAGITLLLLALCAVYLALALRTAFGASRATAAAKGMVLGLGVLVALQAYRFILFVATVWTA